MNYAIIFAGGSGKRMNLKSLPKQFLKVDKIPIIVHTISKFQSCSLIDKIVVVCIKSHIDLMKKLADDYSLSKIISIIPGGYNGQVSIRNGIYKLFELGAQENDVVLIHDGVRPLIDLETIEKNIEFTKKYGNCITSTQSTETVLIVQNEKVSDTVDRAKCYYGRAPQSFLFKDIYKAHKIAESRGLDNFIDSATLMSYFGTKLHIVRGPINNIKITTPIDYHIFKAIYKEEKKRNENKQY